MHTAHEHILGRTIYAQSGNFIDSENVKKIEKVGNDNDSNDQQKKLWPNRKDYCGSPQQNTIYVWSSVKLPQIECHIRTNNPNHQKEAERLPAFDYLLRIFATSMRRKKKG